MQAEFKRLKGRLTFRINRVKNAVSNLRAKSWDRELQEKVVFEAKQLVCEVDYATNIFEDKGFPDAHHRWSRAKEDAQYQIQLNTRM